MSKYNTDKFNEKLDSIFSAEDRFVAARELLDIFASSVDGKGAGDNRISVERRKGGKYGENYEIDVLRKGTIILTVIVDDKGFISFHKMESKMPRIEHPKLPLAYSEAEKKFTGAKGHENEDGLSIMADVLDGAITAQVRRERERDHERERAREQR